MAEEMRATCEDVAEWSGGRQSDVESRKTQALCGHQGLNAARGAHRRPGRWRTKHCA
jgi:hypothetical protein